MLSPATSDHADRPLSGPPSTRPSPLVGSKVLAISPVGGYDGNNTSVHRVRALESLGADVEVVDTAADEASALGRLRYRIRHHLFLRGLPVAVPDLTHGAERALAAARRRHYDIVWLEKALTIGPDRVSELRRLCPRAKIIGFSPDDMCRRHNQSRQFVEALPHYDWFITTKAQTQSELVRLGCRNVVVIGNGFDPEAFRPVSVPPGEIERLGGDIGFIGSYESSRAEAMLELARAGLSLRVWGNGWRALSRAHPKLRIENRALGFEDFAKACSAFKINLGFLRKLNDDRQTTRSVEIPACGGFMLAERTSEHLAMFEEGREAEFFEGTEELLAKCRQYLSDDTGRAAIARRGHERCLSSGYSNSARLREAFGVILRQEA
jgi:spore maturation protein CgeB